MTDKTELKRLAEAANAVIGDVNVDVAITSESGPNQAEIDAVTAFFQLATPAAVLALIAENERAERLALDAVNAEYSAQMGLESTCVERDQLKADNEALRNGLRLARHWCASALKAARVDSQPSELLDIASLLRHQASDIDAAMGKGERS